MEGLLFLILLAILFPATMAGLGRIVLILLVGILMFACVGAALPYPMPSDPQAVAGMNDIDGARYTRFGLANGYAMRVEAMH